MDDAWDGYGVPQVYIVEARGRGGTGSIGVINISSSCEDEVEGRDGNRCKELVLWFVEKLVQALRLVASIPGLVQLMATDFEDTDVRRLKMLEIDPTVVFSFGKSGSFFPSKVDEDRCRI